MGGVETVHVQQYWKEKLNRGTEPLIRDRGPIMVGPKLDFPEHFPTSDQPFVILLHLDFPYLLIYIF